MARMIYYLTVIVIFILSVGCIVERDTKITLKEDTSPPTFVLEGSRYLSRFVVYGPLVSEYATENNRPVAWKIFPVKESLNGSLGIRGELAASWTSARVFSTTYRMTVQVFQSFLRKILKSRLNIPISDLPPIKYGVPPAGWTQYYPSNGTTSTLIEGALYRAVANTNSANSGYIDFTIQHGKVRVLTQPASNSDGR